MYAIRSYYVDMAKEELDRLMNTVQRMLDFYRPVITSYSIHYTKLYDMPNYHRLDLNLHIDGKQQKRFQSSWDISLYNIYNRYNAYSITFNESESLPGTNEATKLSLFGAVPSVTWNFKF